jgi:hypothetical protein
MMSAHEHELCWFCGGIGDRSGLTETLPDAPCAHAYHSECAEMRGLALEGATACYMCSADRCMAVPGRGSTMVDEHALLFLSDRAAVAKHRWSRAQWATLGERGARPRLGGASAPLAIATIQARLGPEASSLKHLYANGATRWTDLIAMGVTWIHLRDQLAFSPSMLRAAYGVDAGVLVRDLRMDSAALGSLDYGPISWGILGFTRHHLVRAGVHADHVGSLLGIETGSASSTDLVVTFGEHPPARSRIVV